MSKKINVSFPRKEEPLFDRIVKTRPKILKLADHARNLMREALYATCATPKRKKK